VKDQYVGDVNDYRKFALLRRLAATGLRVGVCWMLTPGDERNDGRKTGYLTQPVMRRHDPELFDRLGPIATAVAPRRLPLIEQGGLVPGAVYFDDEVPTDRAARAVYFDSAFKHLAVSDLIFFDPDNGLDVSSVRKGQKSSPKFVYRDEVAKTYAAGHSVLVYQHFPREARQGFISRLKVDLIELSPGAMVTAFCTPHVAFLLVAQPTHAAQLDPARIVEGCDPSFIHAS
jgi:hypothetical protein